MAGLMDFGLLNTNVPGQVMQGFIAGDKEARANQLLALQMQHAGTTNELQRYQLGAAQRADADQNALRMALQGVDIGTPEGVATARKAILGTGNIKGAMDLDKSMLEKRKTMGEIDKTEIANRAAKFDAAARDISNFDTREQVLADINRKVVSKELPPEMAMKIMGTIPATDAELPAWQLKTLRGLLSAKDKLEQQFTTQNLGDTSNIVATSKYGGAPPTTVMSSPVGTTPSAQLAADTARRGQNMVDARSRETLKQQPPVAVIDPDTGKQTLVSRDEAINRRMAPATALEGLTPKDIQKREATYPKATLANQEIQTSTKDLITKLEKLKSHPGLSGITGLVFGRTPNVTGDARDAQTLYDNIMSKGQIGVMMALKNASATGATGFGQLSEKEGEVLRKSQAAVDKNQNTADFQAGIDSWIADLKKAKSNAADAYDLTYEYRNTGAKAAPSKTAPAAKGGWKDL
jgi:hypothetical protein